MSGGYRRPVWTRTSACRGSRRNGVSVRFRALDVKAHRDVAVQAPVARAVSAWLVTPLSQASPAPV